MKLRKVIVSILAALFAFVLLILSEEYFFADSKSDKISYAVRGSLAQEQTVEGRITTGSRTEKESRVTNIMLIGVDNDDPLGMNDRGNADGLVLVSINKDTKKIIMTSIMRDISIQVPDKYETKVTLVYHELGTDSLLDTLEENFQIEIDNYVLVNYYNVIDIVDAMGGLDVELTESEIRGMESKINNLNKLTGDPEGTDVIAVEQKGLNHLNGKQVTALLRIRNTDNDDYGRTARARKILSLMVKKALTLRLSEINDLADIITQNITTDISFADMMSLVLKVPGYLRYDFVSNRIPVDDTQTSDEGYLYIDYPINVEALHNTIYGE